MAVTLRTTVPTPDAGTPPRPVTWKLRAEPAAGVEDAGRPHGPERSGPAHVGCRLGTDLGQPRVQVLARTEGVGGIAVAGDDVELYDLPERVPAGVAPARGKGRATVRVATVQAQLPAEDPAERGHDGARHRVGLVIPERRHPDGVGVEPSGVGADHGLVHTTPATLEQAPEAVNDEVVADVRPAQRERVVGIDRPDHAWDVRAGVVRRTSGVMDERRVDRLAVSREAVAQRLVSTPLRACDDRWPRDGR